jgi:probable phosphoglycerate mutase
MRLFGSTKAQRAPGGYHFGRDLAHEDHRGWRKLVLIRHGQTDYNIRHIHQGHLPGIPLNEAGRREAYDTATAIRDLPLTAIVASPLQRTLETAEYINEGRGLTIQQDEDLIEVDFGPYAGQCWDELDVRKGEWTRFVRDPRYAPKGVESFERVQRRAVQAMERWRVAPNLGEWVALVTHSDLVKLIVQHYIGMPLDNEPRLNLDNAAVSVFAFPPDPRRHPTLIAFNWTSPGQWLPSAAKA